MGPGLQSLGSLRIVAHRRQHNDRRRTITKGLPQQGNGFRRRERPEMIIEQHTIHGPQRKIAESFLEVPRRNNLHGCVYLLEDQRAEGKVGFLVIKHQRYCAGRNAQVLFRCHQAQLPLSAPVQTIDGQDRLEPALSARVFNRIQQITSVERFLDKPQVHGAGLLAVFLSLAGGEKNAAALRHPAV